MLGHAYKNETLKIYYSSHRFWNTAPFRNIFHFYFPNPKTENEVKGSAFCKSSDPPPPHTHSQETNNSPLSIKNGVRDMARAHKGHDVYIWWRRRRAQMTDDVRTNHVTHSDQVSKHWHPSLRWSLNGRWELMQAAWNTQRHGRRFSIVALLGQSDTFIFHWDWLGCQHESNTAVMMLTVWSPFSPSGISCRI